MGMSELKAISGHEIREDIDYNTRGIDPENKEWRNYGKELCDTLYYLKSEADKVIAEKDKNIAELEERIADGDKDFEMADHQNERLLKIVRHNKYKRCLDMGKYWLAVSYQCVDDKHRQQANRHRKKWLKLAEKFKEAK